MTEKEFNKLKPGDKVKLVSVDKMCECPAYIDSLNEWAGRIVTIHKIIDHYRAFEIDEDGLSPMKWLFSAEMIERKVGVANGSIGIYARGNKTIAKRDNGKVGIAKCDPKDEFDEAKGAIIAVARAYGWQYASDDTDSLTLTKLGERIKKSAQSVKKRYELLPWDEAKKAVAGTEHDHLVSIYGISKVTWENIRRENEATASDQYNDEEKERYKKSGLVGIDAVGFSWLIPECCIVHKYGDEPSDAAIDKLAEGVFGKPLKETAKDRVERELKELSDRRNSLSRALQGASKKLPESMKVEDEAFNLLEMQLRVMEMYEAILARRLAIWKD